MVNIMILNHLIKLENKKGAMSFFPLERETAETGTESCHFPHHYNFVYVYLE